MGKRSQRRPVRYEKDPSGCMWGLISIFDFRHGRTTQKLLSDRRRGGKHSSGAANPRNKRDKLIHLNENCQETPVSILQDGEENAKLVADANKPRVKELIEEEMFSDQDTTKEARNALEQKKPDSENGSQKKRNHQRAKRTRSRSCDIDIDDLDAAKSLETEHSCLEKLEKEFINHIDMEKIMEKLCQRIKLMSSLNHEQHGEVNLQPDQKIQVLKEKMGKVIKLFITQKIISVNHIAEDGDVHLPENLINVLQMLCADDELFLKLVQDPSSVLIKYGQCMQNTLVEEGEDSKSLFGPKVSDHEPRNLRQSDELVKHKQRNFFRRKAKSMESLVSKGSKTSPQASNTIIILKPGLQNSETDSSIGSSPDSHSIVKNKGPSERIGSHFFITEIKRKLKNAMVKERAEIYTDDVLRTSYESHHLGDNGRGTKEIVGMSSPSKDHFFTERFARPPSGLKKGEKISKLKHRETAVENEAASFPKQRMSNIYVEAKKHLSEMLNMGDEDVVSSSGQVPKTLGRILSLPEYNASSFGSPGRDWGNGFMTAQMRLSNSVKCQKHENTFSHVDLLAQNLESQSSISNANADNEVQPPTNPNMENVSEVIDNEVTISSVVDKLTCEGDEICRSADIVVEEEIIAFITPLEPSVSTDITIDEQDGDICEACDEQKNSECLNQEACEGIERTFSPSASPSNASITKAVEDLETNVYIPERPSPVSVLEPLFTEDDISPASTKSGSAELPVQPLRIQFEECDSSTAEGIHMKTYMDDREQIVEYIKAVLQASDLKWDEVYLMSSSSEQLLDPLLFQELEFFSDQLCRDMKLLFDCINEVLVDLYQPYFGCSPWSSFVKLSIRPVHDMKNVALEVWEGVNWHLIPLPLPHTLDQIVKKDMAKTGTWMDLRIDTESIVFEMGEVIFEELMEDTVLSCINGSSETGELLLLDEIKENKNGVITR